MNKESIFEKIADTISDVSGIAPEEIQESSLLMEDLSLSSMEIITIVADLEETFSCKISESEFRNFITVGDWTRYFLEKLQ